MSDYEKVIELLCEKFGIALGEASKLLPQIIRYNIVGNSVQIAISVVILIITGIAAYKLIRWWHGEDYDEYSDSGKIVTGLCVTGALGLIFLITFLTGIDGLIQFIYMPDVAALKYVMGLVK